MNASSTAGKTEALQIPESVSQGASNIQAFAELPDFLKDMETLNATQGLSLLLAAALQTRASDVHLETKDDSAEVRFRVDGMLQEAGSLSPKSYGQLLSRIKLVSGIKLNVTERPQDGRFAFRPGKGGAIEVRSSTLPTEYGESVVLRILDPKNLVDMGKLGLREDLFALFEEEIQKPHGMILVTGPTGSGKTTTLYAFLKHIQSTEKKILTIEDPIEYRLKGISQTQADQSKEYDFASGLTALLRQDPDVILVGEIRDGSTAKTALQAALTGHLVFSTLHTNEAAGTVSRLLSLGATAANIAPALNLIIAQRLVRKVCGCAKLRSPTKEEQEKLQKALQGIPQKPRILQVAEIQGCAKCGGTGYLGRTGIFEGLQVDEETENFLSNSPSSAQLKTFAKKKKMTTLYQDGMRKAAEGITAIEEVERVAAS
ncbi:GspE/PulE family protein [Patescibacteria group bacterium]|nr:GspE/PulE family protein [Patescibacteria group bacterium]